MSMGKKRLRFVLREHCAEEFLDHVAVELSKDNWVPVQEWDDLKNANKKATRALCVFLMLSKHRFNVLKERAGYSDTEACEKLTIAFSDKADFKQLEKLGQLSWIYSLAVFRPKVVVKDLAKPNEKSLLEKLFGREPCFEAHLRSSNWKETKTAGTIGKTYVKLNLNILSPNDVEFHYRVEGDATKSLPIENTTLITLATDLESFEVQKRNEAVAQGNKESSEGWLPLVSKLSIETTELAARYRRGHVTTDSVNFAKPQAQSVDPNDPHAEADLRKWSEASFSHILKRKREKSVSSNTCMYLYGLDFDPANPKLQRAAPVMALQTDTKHLQDLLGGMEGRSKELGSEKEQIADEIVDIFRCLFMLVIVYGFESFDVVDWAEEFCVGYRIKDKQSDPAMLRNLYDKLRKRLLQPDKRLEQDVLDWIREDVATLGAIAHSRQITIKEIAREFESRIPGTKLYEKRTAHPRFGHARHKFGNNLLVFSCLLDLPDEHGAYSEILKAISESDNYNVLASATTTVVWRETAIAKILFSYESSNPILEPDVNMRLDQVLKKSDAKNRPLIVSYEFDHVIRNHIDEEKKYIGYLRTAIKAFWNFRSFDELPIISKEFGGNNRIE